MSKFWPSPTQITATLLLAAALPVHAGVIADRPSWLTQSTSVTNYDFGTRTAGTEQVYNSSTGLVVSALGISVVGYSFGSFYYLSVAQGATPNPWPWYDWSSGAIGHSDTYSGSYTGGQTPVLRVNFTNGPVTSFAVDLGTGGVSTGSILVTPQGQSGTTLTTQARPNFTFYGYTSTTPFSYVDIAPTTSGAMAIIDNISYGTASGGADPTPEAATILLVGGGLIFMSKLKFKTLQTA